MTTLINHAQAWEQGHPQTHELTEVELSEVSGGSWSTGAGAGKVYVTPSIPIPPPAPSSMLAF